MDEPDSGIQRRVQIGVHSDAPKAASVVAWMYGEDVEVAVRRALPTPIVSVGGLLSPRKTATLPSVWLKYYDPVSQGVISLAERPDSFTHVVVHWASSENDPINPNPDSYSSPLPSELSYVYQESVPTTNPLHGTVDVHLSESFIEGTVCSGILTIDFTPNLE